MTQNTIDLATIASNLSSSSDTASPENIEVCGGKPPFDKSLKEAMQAISAHDDAVATGSEQFLPPVGQELPLERAYSAGLEGVTEVRALADAISAITRGEDPTSQQVNYGLDVFGVTAFAAESTRASTGIPDADSPLGQFEKDLAASRAHPAVAVAVRNVSGFDPSKSEKIKFDLRQEIGAPTGNSNDNINRQIASFNGTPNSGLYEPRITVSDAVLISGATSNKDNTNRFSSVDPGLGLSSIAQSESNVVNRMNGTQSLQQPPMTKSPELVSSNELATHLRVLKSSGGGEARLQLHPLELGRMTVSLITEGDETRVSFVVDNPQAKQAVEVSLPRLRDLMDEAGLSLTDADVSDRHAKGNEEQLADRATEETIASLGSDAEDFEESTPPTSSQLVDTFA